MCKKPLKAWQIGFTESGKRKMHITDYNVKYILIRDCHVLDCYNDKLGARNYDRIVKKYVEVPCGQCLECRINYSRSWADRCLAETQYHQHNWFITFTYDDDHVPYTGDVVNPDTGEISNVQTLVKKDIQLFWKRLRRSLYHRYDGNPPKIMYFACGEYGSQTKRPHYHAIVFGLPIDDLTLYKKAPTGNYYNSEWLQRIWGNGYVVVADATWQSCAYTARYILKKQYGQESKELKKIGVQPEFTAMSLKPAIGKQFYEDHKEEIYGSGAFVSTSDGGRQIRPNRYFDKLLEREDPERLLRLKEKRIESMKARTDLKLSQTDKDYLQMLESELEVLEARISKLPRKEI